MWLASYPFDVVKSKMQTDGLDWEATTRKPAAVQATRAMPQSLGQAAKGAVEGAPHAETVLEKQYGVRKYKNMRDCFAQTWRQEGMGGFWRGLGPTLLRAMPVSAATFFV